jgi:DNA polymerase-3 subunit gamma/tau
VCLSYTDGEISGQLARDVLGTAGRSAMFEFVDALIDGNAGSALTQIDHVMRQGSDPQVFIRDTIAHLRGVMLAGAVKEGLAGLLEITPEDAERFMDQSRRMNGDALDRMLGLFMRAEPDTKWASRPRTILELAAVRACHPEKEADATVWERLDRVEKLVEQGAAAVPGSRTRAAAPKTAEKKAEVRAPAPKPTPAEAPPQAYLDAVAQLQAENPSIRKPLDAMRFIRFDGNQVVVEFAKKNMMDKMLLERKRGMIQEALANAFGQEVGIAMNIEGSATMEKKVSDTARDVINQAYDVFGREKTSIED